MTLGYFGLNNTLLVKVNTKIIICTNKNIEICLIDYKYYIPIHVQFNLKKHKFTSSS